MRPVARIGEIGGLRESVGESVGHIQPRAEFSRVYGLRMTHASLQNPQKVTAKKTKNPPKPLFLTFLFKKKDLILILDKE